MTDYMLRALRRRDRRDHQGRCTITRGTYPSVTTVTVGLPCKVRPIESSASSETMVGGDQVGVYLYEVGIDFEQDIERDDTVTLTTSADPLLVGKHLTVVEVTLDEWVTSRVVVCKRSE